MTSEAVIRRRRRGAALAAASLSVLLVAPGPLLAQEQPAPVAPASGGPASADPRVGLKPGFHNAGEAILNMEKIASLPKPQGFFDPKMPKGEPTPPERPRPASGSAPATSAAGGAASGPAAAEEEARRRSVAAG
jgi:hypothetical protein